MTKRKESGTPTVKSGSSSTSARSGGGSAKQPKTSGTSAAGSSSASVPPTKPTFSLATMLAEIEKLEKPEDIEKSAIKLHTDLTQEWGKPSKDRDMKRLGILLNGAKVLLTKYRYLPLTQNSESSVRDLTIARDILEIGAWYSVAKCEVQKNTSSPDAIKDFERYISQLKHYYFDMRKLIPKDSPNMYEILGMNLLNLLSQYKIADFHRELELFVHRDVDQVLANPYIKKAVEIEQYIGEGQYNKIYALKGAKPEDLKKAGLTSPGFKYFVEHLENTLKEHTREIADVIGSAYDKLSIQAAMHLLNLKDSNKMGEIIKTQNWEVKEGFIYFNNRKDNVEGIPAEQLVQNAVMYASELETII